MSAVPAPQRPHVPIESWPDALEATVASACTLLRTVIVLRETASTQDHARAAGIPVGTLVTAWRQSAGRGRLGRAWDDTHAAGVAVTCALPDDAPESLAMRSAVATARAVRSFLPGDACGIKWPNDIVVDGRKIAGILVERTAGLALVGIGINVGQESFHADIDARATSLARLGIHTDRLAVLDALIQSVDIAFQEPIEGIYRTYCTLDRLTGRSCAFNTPDGSVTGMVRSVDPRLGIQVETASGVLFLPSATTSVVPAHAGSRYGGADVSR